MASQRPTSLKSGVLTEREDKPKRFAPVPVKPVPIGDSDPALAADANAPRPVTRSGTTVVGFDTLPGPQGTTRKVK